MFLRYTFLVAIGGAIGAVARYWTSEFVHIFERGFPLGTMLVNVIGSFLWGFWRLFCCKNFRTPLRCVAFF